MTIKEFFAEIEKHINEFSPEATTFFEELKQKQDSLGEQKFTENGKKILNCMQNNYEKYLNVFSSTQLGELLFMPPRSVSGSMKKLLNEGYAEKKSTNPVTYGLTNLGKNIQFDN